MLGLDIARMKARVGPIMGICLVPGGRACAQPFGLLGPVLALGDHPWQDLLSRADQGGGDLGVRVFP